jgi:hypothetical protein
MARHGEAVSDRRTTHCISASVVGVALIVSFGCGDGTTPTQPAPLSECVIFGITGTESVPVGGTGILTGFQESCRPMYLPLRPESIAWESLDPAVASVTLGVVGGISPGAAVIQGRYGSMSQQVVVIVGGAPPPSASVVRLRLYGAPMMRVNQRATFGALAIFDNGAVTRVSTSATWTSSRPSVAGLSSVADAPAATVDGFSAGSAQITASYQRLTATMTVTVTEH